MTRAHRRGATASGWWQSRVHILTNQVRVECSGIGLADADLQPLLAFVATKLQELAWWTDDGYAAANALTLDISCNPNITDVGICVHLVPFLKQWPACRRLKLYQTSIGDASLRALSCWISGGHAAELHLSDLSGVVTSDAVLQVFREIHQKKKYPYWTGTKGQAASLWLRLEHNSIDGVEQLLAQSQQEGISFRVLDRGALRDIRPGLASTRSPAIDLVLFRSQQQKTPKMEVKESNAAAGEALLTLLNSGQRASPSSGPQQDPQPLSVDEFQLWTMEAREDAERGDNERNTETFGEDDALAAGWSFEENLAANERLADAAAAARYRWYLAQTRNALLATGLSSSPAGVSKYPAEVGSSCSTSEGGASGPDMDTRSGRPSAVSSGSTGDEPRSKGGVVDPRQQIEEEVKWLLQQTQVLRSSDFDGKVRQWLHAYLTNGGTEYLREAMDMLNSAMANKRREDVSKWAAYLCVLLKRFHKGDPDSKAHTQADCNAHTDPPSKQPAESKPAPELFQ
eukprot:TRINITY_DN94229_c0_g1_i1.p1 TRINITY_DN94229_c0_g1~~TRINITY_DN94229_c0_g1_i1.p1  ORF type:complete len:514 (+),score=96.45 TRINITY_DN94229_c0_g1_i1:142-1683(+)